MKRQSYRAAPAALLLLVIAGLALFSPPQLHAAGTPAGTVITNQATATFRYGEDASLTTVSSNIVAVTVAQRAALNLSPVSGAQTTRLNKPVDYPFTLVNAGNGTDRFSLAWTSSLGLAAGLYMDSDGDRLLSSTEAAAGSITQTPDLPADAAMGFILRLNVPDNPALMGQADLLTLSSSSLYDPAMQGTLTRSTSIVAALLALRSSVSTTLPRAGDRVTYMLEYQNSGNGEASGINITDLLDDRLRYVTGSASPPPDTVSGPSLVWSNLGLPAGTAGVITFQAEIMNNVAPGMEIHNVASGNYRDGENVRSVTGTEVNFMTVQSSGLVTVSFTNDTTCNAEAGDTLRYRFVVKNEGALPEQFILSSASTLGFAWTFYEDPAGSETEQPGSGPIANTGEIPAGSTFALLARAVIPLVAIDQTRDFTTFRVQSSTNPANFRTATGSTLVGIPRMSLMKEATPPDPVAGSEITYRITYVNSGHGHAYDFAVSDLVPENTVYVPQSTRVNGIPATDEADQDDVTMSGGILSVAPGTIAPEGQGVIEFRVRIL